ncbi:hypothetical protein D3C84_1243420 [compost metagenome]
MTKCLAVARFNRARQVINLVARVIDIVLTGYFITCEVQHVAQCIAHGCAARMAEMKAARRIRANEFNLYALA